MPGAVMRDTDFDDDPVDTAWRRIIQASNAIGVKVPGITDSQILEARRLAVESIMEANYRGVDV